jgi:hypothetical protein
MLEAMAGVTYSVREQQGTGYGPVIGNHVAAGDVPPDDGTLIEIKGKLMRVVAVRADKFDAANNTIIVEPYADPG